MGLDLHSKFHLTVALYYGTVVLSKERTMNTSMTKMTDMFGPVISSYTRKQAIEDGEQVALDTKMTTEAGIKYPIYMTRAAFAAAVETGGTWDDNGFGDKVLTLPFGQDVQGRIWDVLSVIKWKMRQTSGSRLSFSVSVYGANGDYGSRNVCLVCECGPMDIDNAKPALTIMLPNED